MGELEGKGEREEGRGNGWRKGRGGGPSHDSLLVNRV